MAAHSLTRRSLLGGVALAGLSAAGCGVAGARSRSLLNVSYDPTRELFEAINRRFLDAWAERGRGRLAIDQSHGGSGKQARAVLDGLRADVVTLALAYDIDAIAQRGKLLPADWQKRLPNNSCPFTSTIVFLVRKGNPQAIQNWTDLTRAGVSVITPNPKTSGGARWNYLAAWGFAEKQFDGNLRETADFVARLYRNAPLLDSGARAATTTFAQRKMGDVLVAWEAEAHLALRQFPDDGFEIVIPPRSILAEPPVALVDEMAQRNGTSEMAQAYLEFLYHPRIQSVAASQFFRPSVSGAAAPFPPVEMLTIDRDFGGWAEAHRRHFADGGTFDRIYQPEAPARS
ncbi:MAG: sulfate ABC transporter substrate-binding protein [Bryobacterales bacterium]|nr:sulfate ABC transporter substrate-binding protein [Bryobacterales bacterium]